jgi:LmbE family N-acetylglucosaminyl deacetylase
VQDRILIIAPHPDDEVLAAGGVIATVSKLHDPVNIRVVVATNGDASYATAIFHGSHMFTKKNFRRQALQRQQESLNALACVGLGAGQVHFWGFPDRGLASLWRHQLKMKRSYYSATTGYRNSAQALNSPVLPFFGASLLALFEKELFEFQPTIVIMPHPQDNHLDHRALAEFAILAAANYHARVAHPLPTYFAYWMWRQARPFLSGARLRDRTRWPVRKDISLTDMRCLTLTAGVRMQKVRALRCYSSQKVAAGHLLLAAARSDSEIFTVLRPASQT